MKQPPHTTPRHPTATDGYVARFLSDLFNLSGGTACGHLVILLVSPLLTRLITPVEMGVFGTFTTIVALLSVTASLGYETAIVNIADDEDALRLVGVVIILTLLGSLALMIGLHWFLIFNPTVFLPIWLPGFIAVTTVVANTFIALQFWYIRKCNYRLAGIGSLFLNAGRGLASVGLAASLGGMLALPLGDLVGRIIGIAVIDRSNRLMAALGLAWRQPSACLKIMVVNGKFTLYQMPSSVLEVSLVWLPVPATAVVFGPEAAGQMALVQRIFAAPMALIGKNLADIFHQRISKSKPEHLMRVTLAVLGAVVAAFVPVCIILIIFGDSLFMVVFGNDWMIAGKICQILSPLLGLQIVGAMMTRLLIVLNRQEIKLIFMVLMLLGYAGAFGAGFYLNLDFLTTVIIMMVTGTTAQLGWLAVGLFITYRYSRPALPGL